MPSRHEARSRALSMLYEADVRGRRLGDVLDAHVRGDDAPPAFAVTLVEGVQAERDALDALIRAHALEWKLERMPVVDRNLLRLATWELLHTPVPTPVVINEAVNLAKELSTDDSGRFVNGVLARVAAQRPSSDAS